MKTTFFAYIFLFKILSINAQSVVNKDLVGIKVDSILSLMTLDE